MTPPPFAAPALAFAAPALLPRGAAPSAAAARPHKAPRWRATATAPAPHRRQENAPGNFYVRSTCIDCDTCRWLAPQTFGIAGPQSHVHAQPASRDAELHALRAAAACPTGSIRTEAPHALAGAGADAFPLPVSPFLTGASVPDVFFNGYTAAENYGAASWLVLHRGPGEAFAVMFDSPRFDARLAANIRRVAAAVGGVRYLVLSHKDDVAHHAAWAAALGAARIIHEKEVVAAQGTDAAEIQLADGQLPLRLGAGVELIHAPGHSPGSLVMLHGASQSLFTGDHLVYMERLGGLGSAAEYCTQSWSLQIENVAKLAELPFLHIWPGHMRPFHFADAADRRRGIDAAVRFMSAMHCPLP